MEIIIHQDSKSACDYAARLIEKLVRSKPNAVLGLATGGLLFLFIKP